MASFSKELTLERLKEFLSFSSISADPKYRKELDRTARWLEIYLTSLGFKAETIPAKTASLVYAEAKFDKNLPTLLIYSHYDVQPAEPLHEWDSPPFEPTVRKGEIIARGVSDSKGQLFAYISGIAKMLKEKGKLPWKEVRRQMMFRPWKLFWKMYVKQGGCRDGSTGFFFAALFAFFHHALWAKYWEKAEAAA